MTRPSRIVVDLLGYTGSRGGTETYARELLPRLADRMGEVDLHAVTGRTGTELVTQFFPGEVSTLSWVGGSASSWALGAVAASDRTARRLGADLIWASANFGPVHRGVPRVVTVHDAIYDEVPGSVAASTQRRVTSWLMRRSAQTADAVLTVSHAAAESLRTHLDVDPRRITVIHNGSSTPMPVADPWAVLAGLRLPRGRALVLSTGNRMPHKNFIGLLDALAAMPVGERPFTVIGGGGTQDPLSAEVARRDLASDVLLPGWVSDDELEALYRVADLYVCPSLAEGFGLPVVDALRRETPVVANDVSVLREVGGDAVTYADATEPTAFAAALRQRLAAPPDAQERRRGREWAERFTWDRAADQTAHALRTRLAAGGSPRR